MMIKHSDKHQVFYSRSKASFNVKVEIKQTDFLDLLMKDKRSQILSSFWVITIIVYITLAHVCFSLQLSFYVSSPRLFLFHYVYLIINYLAHFLSEYKWYFTARACQSMLNDDRCQDCFINLSFGIKWSDRKNIQNLNFFTLGVSRCCPLLSVNEISKGQNKDLKKSDT